MSAINKGTKWEDLFREQFQESFPNAYCFRINNNMSGYHGIANICDFICFDGTKLYLMELKAHAGASIPFDKIRQIPLMDSLKYVPNTVAGVLLWLYEKNKVLFIPLRTLKKLVANGEKSVGLRHLKDSEYEIFDIPFKIQRVYPKVDYTIFTEDRFLL